jgi:hypothetical protein
MLTTLLLPHSFYHTPFTTLLLPHSFYHLKFCTTQFGKLQMEESPPWRFENLCWIFCGPYEGGRDAVDQLVESLLCKPEVREFDSQWCNWNFSLIFRPQCGPGVVSAAKWIPGIFPRGKGGRCGGLTNLLSSCADCHDIWESQPPESLRPVQACNGIALPYILPYFEFGYCLTNPVVWVLNSVLHTFIFRSCSVLPSTGSSVLM